MILSKKAFNDSKWNSVDFIWGFFISLTLMRYLIAELGVEGYGFYSLFFSLIATFGLVDVGMGVAVSKYLSEYLNQKKFNEANQVICMAVIFYVTIGTFITLATLASREIIISFFNFSPKYHEIALKIIILLPMIMTLNFLSQVANSILVAYEEWKMISLLNLFFKTIDLIAALLIFKFFNAESVLVLLFSANMICVFLRLLIQVLLGKKQYNGFKVSNISRDIFKKLVSFLSYTSASFIFSIFLGHLDSFIIAKFLGLEPLGLYQVVLKVINYLHSFFSSIFKILLPKLSALHGASDYSKIDFLVKKSLKVSIFMSIASAIGVFLIWKPTLGAILGHDVVVNSFDYLKYFLLFFVVRTPEVIYYYLFNACALPKVFVSTTFLESIVNVAFYLILIPRIGVLGVIVSRIVSKFSGVMLMGFLYERLIKNQKPS